MKFLSENLFKGNTQIFKETDDSILTVGNNHNGTESFYEVYGQLLLKGQGVDNTEELEGYITISAGGYDSNSVIDFYNKHYNGSGYENRNTLKIKNDGTLNLPNYTGSKVLTLDGSKNIVSTYDLDQNLSTTNAPTFATNTKIQTNANAGTNFSIINTTDGTASNARITLTSNNSQYLTARVFAESFTTVDALTTADSVSIYSSGCANGLRIGTQEATDLIFATNNTARLTINGAGNIGFGTTDIEDWSNNYSALEFGKSALIGGNTTTDVYLLRNNYYDGTNWKYKSSSSANRIFMTGGKIYFSTADSGTIDTNIDWINPLIINNDGSIIQQVDQNNATLFDIRNDIEGNVALSAIRVTKGNGTQYGILEQRNHGATSSGLLIEDSVCIFSSGNSNGLRVFTHDSTNLTLGTNNISRLIINNAGDTTVQTDKNSATILSSRNDTNNTNSAAWLKSAYSTTQYGALIQTSPSYSSSGLAVSSAALLQSNGNSNGLRVYTLDSTNLTLGTNNTPAITINSSQQTTFAGIFTGISNSSIKTNQNGNTIFSVRNDTLGSSAASTIRAMYGNGVAYVAMGYLSSDYTSTNMFEAGKGCIYDVGVSSNGLNVFTTGENPLTLGTNNTARVTINSSGNIGFGTTDIEDWNSSFRVLEWSQSAIMGGNSGNSIYILSNLYNDGAWKFKTEAPVSQYYQSSGTHIFKVAPSGTINTAVPSLYTGLAIDNNRNNLINAASAETSSVGALTMKQGTDPTTSSADQISIFATSGADCTLGLRTEKAVISETPTPDRTLLVKINGATYKLCLEYVSGE